MIPVWSRAGARAADREASEGLGLPSWGLMEVASRGLAEVVRAHPGSERGVVVVCGPGNNGGDGFGCARWLHRAGVPVATLAAVPTHTGDAGLAREAARRAGVPEVQTLGEAGLLVDALFGTGLTRPVEGELAELLAAMEAHGAPVVAADLPSGLDADTGQVHGRSLHAATTVSFGGGKQGLYAGEGPRRSGRVEVVDLGLDPALRQAEVADAGALAALWPVRAVDTFKTRQGRLLIIAGSSRMAGAAMLCAHGALAGGAGLITLMAPERAWPRLTALRPEIMLVSGGPEDVWDGRPGLGLDSNAIAIGPGLGSGMYPSDHTRKKLLELDAMWERPMVVDADALAAVGTSVGPRVLTPHPGEAARRLGCTTAEIEADRFAAVRRLAGGQTVGLLKGPRTLVARAEGPVSINPTGNPVLASGGTGDVLTGVIGALLAQGVDPWDAARLGAWVHGLAGDLLAARRSQGWGAADVAAAIPDAVEALRRA
ncbi:MAG: NAD(P)H-hydrate dehydratase [Alphaproteobacteria bacterium]|nr:NAD(P)H-hydrate dehydratase [Alphaproteobacteria bacterium]